MAVIVLLEDCPTMAVLGRLSQLKPPRLLEAVELLADMTLSVVALPTKVKASNTTMVNRAPNQALGMT